MNCWIILHIEAALYFLDHGLYFSGQIFENFPLHMAQLRLFIVLHMMDHFLLLDPKKTGDRGASYMISMSWEERR